MGRRHAIAIATALGLLAAPAAAAAKEVSKVSVCGMDRTCVVYDGSDFKSLMFLADDAGPTDPPAAAAPWYRVRFTVDAREHGGGIESWTVAYVPSADTLRVREEGGDFAWVALAPRSAAVLERAVRRLPAFPTASLRGLEVEPPQVRVSEVVSFAARPHVKAGESATTPWAWVAGGALAATLVLLTVARTLRRRGGSVLPAR